MFLTPEQVDQRLSWPLGRAERLARQRRLPHVLLPDGRVRFLWEQIERLIVYVPAATHESLQVRQRRVGGDHEQ